MYTFATIHRLLCFRSTQQHKVRVFIHSGSKVTSVYMFSPIQPVSTSWLLYVQCECQVEALVMKNQVLSQPTGTDLSQVQTQSVEILESQKSVYSNSNRLEKNIKKM